MTKIQHILSEHIKELLSNLQTSPIKKINNISSSHHALLLSFYNKPFIVIENSAKNASELYRDFLFFQGLKNEPNKTMTFLFPTNTNPQNVGIRVKTLNNVCLGENINIITSIDALQTEYNLTDIHDRVFNLQKGDHISREKFNEILLFLGYKEVSIVVERGDFVPKGWIFDVYPVTEELPVRIEFFGDEVDIIRFFDVETQRSIREIQKITFYPASEAKDKENNLLTEIKDLHFYDIFCEFSTYKTLTEKGFFKDLSYILFSRLPIEDQGVSSAEVSIAGAGLNYNERKSLKEFPEAVKIFDKEVLLFLLPSEAQAQRLKEVFYENNLLIPIIDKKDLFDFEGDKCITIGLVSSGFSLAKLCILTDKEIFGSRVEYKHIKKSSISNILEQLEEFNNGDFVVHEDHGIGKFIGLSIKHIEDYKEELVIIEYANSDKLYVPTYNINKIKKYSSVDKTDPSLDRLGSKRWQKTKQKIKKDVKEMAENLLKLYAERKVVKGFKFSEDSSLHREFDEFFPYDMTEDQIKAFEEIKKHMMSEKPMDMLLCGDVGFGKTEVAMRAAFRAIYDGKQVAVVVPTTLLAEQHYRTFRTRFSPFAVNVDYISRFKNKKEIKECLKALEKGSIDIIIGTHMLLKKDIIFNDLGLLIIDEEHRFGVIHKERLKELKKVVDVLTLTATPIPRTLHLSLSGIREMTTIGTPPEDRLAVKTYITKFGEKVIKEAIEREIKRKGQVFFVHNRINDIDKMAEFLKKLLPDIRIAIAHGRMKERHIESIMAKFIDGEIDVLLCTSIIGAGLDITNANTLIVNKADTFGLADLYQLRGRVGRSSVEAYAYFLISDEDIISTDAKKRLKALHEMSYLGAGLKLALKDLEIRGAGNILGKEQSGHINRVGFDTYLEILEKAVSELKGEIHIEELEPLVRFRISALVPDSYISDITIRLGFYRRLAKAKSVFEIKALKDELKDRFGPLPFETNNLLKIMSLKVLAKKLYIAKILDMGKYIKFVFSYDKEEIYKIPRSFFKEVLSALFSIAAVTQEIRLCPDGFELKTEGMTIIDVIERAEEILQKILIKITTTINDKTN
ncbi:MAG: transcription-repair coupling factor [Thermodesulfovibrionales bacterium]|nr:transcription-repair coupling factor [Thermodesulfovibrionales bacterium]